MEPPVRCDAPSNPINGGGQARKKQPDPDKRKQPPKRPPTCNSPGQRRASAPQHNSKQPNGAWSTRTKAIKPALLAPASIEPGAVLSTFTEANRRNPQHQNGKAVALLATVLLKELKCLLASCHKTLALLRTRATTHNVPNSLTNPETPNQCTKEIQRGCFTWYRR